MPKVTVVGAGQVGSTTAMRLADWGICDVTLIDADGDLAQGKALDISQSLSLTSSAARVEGGGDYALAEGSEVAVVAAGFARRPGMSREDLLARNASIVREVVTSLAQAEPDCALIVVTNPLDEMSYLAWKITGWDRRRVAGMAGLLDGARYAFFIARELGVHPGQVSPMVLGSHGDAMLPLERFTTVNGVPLSEMVDASRLEELKERTRRGGAEIVSLLKTGSAYYAPSACVAVMVRAMLEGEGTQMPASVLLEGEYGLEGVFLGVPVVLGKGGWKDIIELPLLGAEMEELKACAGMARKRLEELDEWLAGAG